MIINLNNKNKLNLCIIVFTITSILITSYIFYNSFQKADDSNKRSDKIVEHIKPIVDPEEKIDKEDFTKYTRKAAHVIEFAMLGISVGIVFVCIYIKTCRLYISLALLLMLFVGVVDEFIQNFNDRASSVKDVLIDFSGSCGGLLIVAIIMILSSHIKHRKMANKL